MRRHWLPFPVLAAALISTAALAASAPPTPEDYLRVLTNGPWPLEILAVCYSTIDRDPALQATGSAGGRAMTGS